MKSTKLLKALDKKIKEFYNTTQLILYPKNCVSCGVLLNHSAWLPLCMSCELQMESSILSENLHSDILKRTEGLIQIEFAQSMYFFSKDSVSQKLIHEIKYGGQHHLFHKIGEKFGDQLISKQFFKSTELYEFVPVPNHWLKRIKQGYNQTEIFCNGLSKSTQIGVDDSILRKKFSFDSQTLKTKAQRYIELKDKYECNPKRVNPDKHYIIVDDVITSGATIEHCYNALKKNGATKISVISLMVVSN